MGLNETCVHVNAHACPEESFMLVWLPLLYISQHLPGAGMN
jgi:hypothetical protein